MRLRSLALAVAMTLTAAASVAGETKPAASAKPQITIVGKLQKAVVSSCQIVREDKTNKVFSFTKSKYKNGTRVRITAQLVDVSICQQGTPIAIKKIVKTK